MYYNRRTPNGFILGAERVRPAQHDVSTDSDTPLRYYYLPRTVDILTRIVIYASAVGLCLIFLIIVLVLASPDKPMMPGLVLHLILVPFPPPSQS